MKTKVKRIGALLLAIAILCSITVAADAATVDTAVIDTSRTGSIDIYKYDLTRANTDDTAAAMIDSYVSTGIRDTELEAVLDDGTVNNLGNGQQSYGYAVKGVEFSYLKVGDICTYSETESDGVHRNLILYKMNDSTDVALLTALGLSNADAYLVAEGYAEPGYHYFVSDTMIDALSGALDANATTVKNALENYMAVQSAATFPETDAHGHTSVDELPLGLYLIVETKVPEMVVSTCSPFFVSLPMTSVNGTNAGNGGQEWLYDVVLYPKNETGIPALTKEVRSLGFDVPIAPIPDPPFISYEAPESSSTKAASSAANDDGFSHNATASTGDRLEYRFIDKLPAISSQATALTVWKWDDTLSKGLEYNGNVTAENAGLLNGHFNPNDVEIHFFRDSALTEKITDWKLTDVTPKFSVSYGTGKDGATTMNVTVTAAGLDEINTAATVHTATSATEKGYSNCYVMVTYSATLNQNADVVFGDDGNPNTVVLTWQRSNMSYYDTLVDDCHVYTYMIELTKEFSDGRGDFSKVNFKARNLSDGYWLVARMDSDGLYYVTDRTIDENEATVFVPNSTTGILTIRGVENDTYVLTETQTDDGYTLLRDSISVVITVAEDETRPCGIYETDLLGHIQNDPRYGTFDGYQELGHVLLTASATVEGKDVTMNPVEGSANALVPLTVVNTSGPELPRTGDDGVWRYSVYGILMMTTAAFVIVLVLKSKKKTASRK